MSEGEEQVHIERRRKGKGKGRWVEEVQERVRKDIKSKGDKRSRRKWRRDAR